MKSRALASESVVAWVPTVFENCRHVGWAIPFTGVWQSHTDWRIIATTSIARFPRLDRLNLGVQRRR